MNETFEEIKLSWREQICDTKKDKTTGKAFSYFKFL